MAKRFGWLFLVPLLAVQACGEAPSPDGVDQHFIAAGSASPAYKRAEQGAK